jgi:hypothetical protein
LRIADCGFSRNAAAAILQSPIRNPKSQVRATDEHRLAQIITRVHLCSSVFVCGQSAICNPQSAIRN